jgi:hypothetical protein
VFYTNGPWVGLPQTTIDVRRCVTNTFAYDDFRRVATSTTAGALTAQSLVTTFQYDSGGLVTNYTQSSGVNPQTSVVRAFDGYGQMTNEQISIAGALQNSFAQIWDAGGRRQTLQSPTAQFNYAYRADGLMTGVSAFGYTCNYSYCNNGILKGRSNPWRTWTVNSFDGEGRPLQETSTAGAAFLISQIVSLTGGINQYFPIVLGETLSYRPDSTLASHAATRSGTGAWSDSRAYQYNVRGQLTNEPVAGGAGAMEQRQQRLLVCGGGRAGHGRFHGAVRNSSGDAGRTRSGGGRAERICGDCSWWAG